MYKKLISIILSAVLLLSSLPALADSESLILLTNSFESYAENATKFGNSISVQPGLDKRVIRESNGNKALYAKAWGESVRVRANFTSPEGEARAVYSAKLKLDGSKTGGKLFTLSDGTNTITFLSISDKGVITIPDGSKAGTIRYGVWNEITLVVNWSTCIVDVYLNGKNIVNDRYFTSKVYLPMKEIQWFINEPSNGSAELYLDDIRIYTGSNLPSKVSFPKENKSTEVLDFEPTMTLDTETKIFMNNTYDSGLGSISISSQGGKAEHKVLDDGNGVLHMHADSLTNSKTYFDTTSASLANEGKYVISADFKINKLSTSASYITFMDGKDSSGTWRTGVSINKDLSVRDRSTKAILGYLNADEWNTLALAYNIGNGQMDLYINGTLVYDNALISDSVYPTIFRVDVISPTGSELDIYMDNLRMYKAVEPLSEDYFAPADDETNEPVQVSTGYSVMDYSSRMSEYIGDATIFMLSANYMYAGGKKTAYPGAKPEVTGGTAMLPLSLIEAACKVTTAYNASTGEIKIGDTLTLTIGNNVMKTSDKDIILAIAPYAKNDNVFVPLRAVAADGLGMYVRYDYRDFIIISKNEFEHTDNPYFLEDKEPIDEIYRYMQFDNPSGTQMVADLISRVGGRHPRVLLTSEEINYILDKVDTGDIKWKNAYNNVISAANGVLGNVTAANPADSEKQSIAGGLESRMYKICLAYLLTGDEKYAETAVKNLDAACSWGTLGERTSQLTSGDWMLSAAYIIDSCYDYLQSNEYGKEVFEKAKKFINSVPFENMILGYSGKSSPYYWMWIRDNFSGFVAGGAMALVIALADEPDMQKDCEYLIENIYKTIEIPITLSAPDGAWYEGVHYGEYNMRHLSKAFLAMQNSCGSTYGLLSARGIGNYADWHLYTGTKVGTFNFHDASPGYSNSMDGFKVAYLLGDLERMEAVKRQVALNGGSLDVICLMLYDKLITDKGISINLDNLPLDHYFRTAETGTFYSSLTDVTPVFVGFHGGYTGMPHDHLDLGQFYFTADGIVWAFDLGKDDYSISNYFGQPEGYSIYRKNVQGDNVLAINPVSDPNYYGQEVGASAALIDFAAAPRAAKAAYDLTAAYQRDVQSYVRGYYFGDNRNTLTVRDEVVLKGESDVYWQMHTPADIEIVDNSTVILTENGRSCRVDIACSNSEFEIRDADPALLPGSPGLVKKGQNSNDGYRKLVVYTKAPAGELNITVKLSPVNEEYIITPIDGTTKISDWTLPEGDVPEKITLDAIYANGVAVADFYPELCELTVTLPFGTKEVPQITADCTKAEIKSITQGSYKSPAQVVIGKEGYHDVTYKITFTQSTERDIFITDALADSKPKVGIHGTLVKPVSISGSAIPEPENGPTNAIDDTFSTRYAIENECWIEADLGEVTDITGVALSFADGNLRNAIYDLAYSEDGINYTKVFSGQATGETLEYESLMIAGRARYIRYIGHGNTLSKWNSITEFRALK